MLIARYLVCEGGLQGGVVEEGEGRQGCGVVATKRKRGLAGVGGCWVKSEGYRATTISG